MEQDYFHDGGANASQTLYLFRQQVIDDPVDGQNSFWQLAGVVTSFKSGNKPGYVADLGNSFKVMDAKLLQAHNSEYEMKFFQKECMQYLDEYMLIEGVHLVKRVASTDNFKNQPRI